MKPTTSQVMLAQQVLANKDHSTPAQVTLALHTVDRALTIDGWTGVGDDCPAYGVVAAAPAAMQQEVVILRQTLVSLQEGLETILSDSSLQPLARANVLSVMLAVEQEVDSAAVPNLDGVSPEVLLALKTLNQQAGN